MISYVRKYQDEILLGVILALAAFLRFFHTGQIPFTHDEFSALARTQFSSFRDLIEQGVKAQDTHPPLIQVFLFYWVKIGGYSEFMVKFPFLLCGVASVYLIYRLAAIWFSTQTGLFAASFVAVSQYTIFYSQIARPYSSGLFLVLLFVYCWTRLIQGEYKNRILMVACYSITGVLASLDHHFALLQIAVIGTSGLFIVKKAQRIHYLIANVLVFLLYVPNLPVFFAQLKVGGIGGWLAKPSSGFILGYLGYVCNYSWIWGGLFAGSIIALVLITMRKIQLHFKQVIVLLWFVIPYFTAYFYSVYVNSLLQYSILIFSFPFLLIFMSSFAGNVTEKWKVAVVLILLVSGIFSLFEQHYYRRFYASPYDEFVKQTECNGRENSLCLNVLSMNAYDSTGTFGYALHWCRQKYDAKSVPVYADRPQDYHKLMQTLSSFPGNEVFYGSLAASDPVIFTLIQSYFPDIKMQQHLAGGDITRFQKHPPANWPGNDCITNQTFDANAFGWSGFDSSRFMKNGMQSSLSYRYDSLSEWGPSFSAPLSRIASPIDYIDVSADVFIPLGFTDAKLVSTLENDTVTIDWRASSFSDFMQSENSWNKVFLSIKLTDNKQINNETRLKIFIWNNNRQRFFVDNIQLRVRPGNSILYWPNEPEQKE